MPGPFGYPSARCDPEMRWIATFPSKIERLDSHIAPNTQASEAKVHPHVRE